MSQLKVEDLNFCQPEARQEADIVGGRITPGVSTAADTALDTRLERSAVVDGNLQNGFSLNRFARGSAASAAASAVSLGGRAFAFASAEAG